MKKKIYFMHDGCDGHIDSFRLIASCAEEKYDITTCISEADVIIHFTCGFTKTGNSLSFFVSSLAVTYKNKKENAITIITGCGINMYKREIFESLPNTFVVELPNFVEEVCRILNVDFRKGEYYIKDSPEVLQLDIVRGCLKKGGYCYFCKFNYLDIPFKSLFTIEEIVEIVEKYKIKILNLTGTNTTSYGLDLGDHKPKLHLLIQEVSKIPQLKWISVSSVASSGIYPELIREIQQNEKIIVINYFFQSGSQRMLDIMNIQSTIETHEEVIRAFKDKAITTAFVVSHPGEGEKELQETLEFIRKHSLWYADVIPFISSNDTPSSMMRQLPDIQYWRHYILVKDEIRKLNKRYLDGLVGKKISAVIDNISKDIMAQCIGIDARCEVTGTTSQIADRVEIYIDGVKDYEKRILKGTRVIV